jgi:hypothetical protein
MGYFSRLDSQLISEGFVTPALRADRRRAMAPVVKTCRGCGHDAPAHDFEGGFCNRRILTVLDTSANCPCVGYCR